MVRRKCYLVIQAALCALTAGLLAAAAVSLYLSGTGQQAEGGIFSAVFTREKAGARLLPILPLLFATLGMAAAGIILGIRDEKEDQPVRDEKMLRDIGRIREKAVSRQADRKTVILRTAVLVIALILIIAGILNGGLGDVFAKGTVVCSECVGLG